MASMCWLVCGLLMRKDTTFPGNRRLHTPCLVLDETPGQTVGPLARIYTKNMYTYNLYTFMAGSGAAPPGRGRSPPTRPR